MEMYDNENTAQKSFDIDFLTEPLLQAQWAEFIELKKVITELFLAKGSPLSILEVSSIRTKFLSLRWTLMATQCR